MDHGRIATVSGVHPPARFGEMVLGEGTRVSRFHEKPSVELQPRRVRATSTAASSSSIERIFDYLSTDDGCILEREPIERLAKDGELCVYQHDGFWQCMDTPKDREMLDAMLELNRLARQWRRAVLSLEGGLSMRVLITGNKGYIGPAMTSVLREAGHEVAGLDSGLFDECQLEPDTDTAPTLDCDLRDRERLGSARLSMPSSTWPTCRTTRSARSTRA